VAYHAKVSQTAVSLAFRNDPSLPPATRRRILAKAEELGYRPDPVLSSLVAYRQSNRPTHYLATLAWIETLAKEKRGSDHSAYLLGARERAEELGFQIEIFEINNSSMPAQRISRIMAPRNMRGALIAPLPTSHGPLRLDWDNLSAVAIGYTLQAPLIHLVANHHYRSMLMMVEKLRALGYSRIGLAIPGVHDKRLDHSYSAAFLVAQRDVPAVDRIPCHVPEQLEFGGFVKWFQKHRLDALITVGYGQVNQWLDDLKVRIPDDLGVAHISPRPGGRNFAAIVENSRLIGRIAIDFLAGLLQRNECGIPEFPKRTLIESKWVEGDTLRRQQ
jgi:DNA-binding LacI/PurR family transcriptional regulator